MSFLADMMNPMIKVLVGDMFQSKADALVNTVNCVGVMGKGIAAEFKKRFPHMYEMYAQECKAGNVRTGKLNIYRDLFGSKLIINFPTKRHWKSPTLLSDIEAGLNYFRDHYQEWDIKSVAFPPLGCGNGGLSWMDVGPLMYSKLSDLNIAVEIYAPFGTSADELTKEFLTSVVKAPRRKGRMVRGSLHEGEVAVLEVLFRIQREQYAKQIGRVMFQKACYILTEAGVQTEMVFERNSFGPYSPDAQHSLVVFANNNLVREERVGGMFKVVVTDEYKKVRQAYHEYINANERGIAKAADLLGRIKNTDQGEEVATIMYASKILALQKKRAPKPQEVIDYIFDWKKKWKHTKSSDLLSTIGDLAMLGWIKVTSDDAFATI